MKVKKVKWGITNSCNLNCKHCFIGDNINSDDDIALDKSISILSALIDTGVNSVVFATAEPLLYHGIYELINFCYRNNVSTMVVTNGILLDDVNKAKRLIDSGVSNIFISLDGITEQSHDAIRGKGVFEKAINALKNLETVQSIGKHVPVGIQMTLNRYNYPEIESIAEFINTLPVRSLSVSNISIMGNSKENNFLKLSNEEFKHSWHMLYESYLKMETKNYYLVCKSMSALETVYNNMFYNKDFLPFRLDCSFTKDTICVMSNGNLTLCDLVPENDKGYVGENMPINEISVYSSNENEFDSYVQKVYDYITDIKSKNSMPCSNCYFYSECMPCINQVYKDPTMNELIVECRHYGNEINLYLEKVVTNPSSFALTLRQNTIAITQLDSNVAILGRIYDIAMSPIYKKVSFDAKHLTAITELFENGSLKVESIYQILNSKKEYVASFIKMLTFENFVKIVEINV